ncbi:unnamed protein product [Heligmosomoides polygyrus]|uniref:Secreted protein n=1 Tax=Heligmosomoides polygyrus TaxID=6339 RepID=A0A183FMB8_HELPZ|nr:unnamed protein product [Heligmosomoides polygyrus]
MLLRALRLHGAISPLNKCYSCSSPLLHLRWPKDEETNRMLFLREFPWYANESCDQVKNMLPVVDCPNSVCIKAVITEPPAKRDLHSKFVNFCCISRHVAAFTEFILFYFILFYFILFYLLHKLCALNK